MSPAYFAIPVGLLLLTTAALKLIDLVGGGLNSSAWFDPLVILFEVGLGFGLVITRRSAGLWMVTLLTFLAFAGLNLNTARIGLASCGCFGMVSVSPWYALALDGGVLGVLTLWAFLVRDVRSVRRGLPDAAAFLLGFALTAAVWLSIVHLGFGSTAAAKAALRGDKVFLEPPVIDFGTVPGGIAAEQQFVIHNSGPDAIRVIGGTSNCACTLIPDLPATVSPGESRQLRVRMNVPASSGAFQTNAVLWTDSPTNETIPVLLRGRSVGPEGGQ
jgi:hypothetical protein